jgi:cytochrome c-type biogenesis protein CcsB
MKAMAVLMLIFAVATGYATFIENDFGTMTAKAEIYNARWFEVLLFVLAANLLINIFRFRMIQRKKALVLLFHVSFLIIAVGAAVTRYVGFEGMMHIREGDQSHTITSTESFVTAELKSGGETATFSEAVLLSKLSQNRLERTLNAGGQSVSVKLAEYLPNATYEFTPGEGGSAIARVMVTGPNGAERLDLAEGEYFEGSDAVIDFGSGRTFDKPVISLFVGDGKLMMRHEMALNFLNMDDRSNGELAPSEEEEVVTRRLLTYGTTNFVLREFHPSAVKKLVAVPARPKMQRFPDALVFVVTAGGETQRLTVFGTEGAVGEAARTEVAGMEVAISYGAKPITLPFAIALKDFQLERYPGSMSPASYASEVVLIDDEQGINEPYRIYMNHVLDHRGYRFFQSSYDQDEGGTILSVNHDPGTPITYIGYLMLAIGMFGALFMPNGRFRELMRKAHNVDHTKEALAAFALVAFALALPAPAQAEEVNPIVKAVTSFDKAHAERFGKLIIQDSRGRMKPMDTLAMQIVNKVHRSGSIMGMTANQIVLGMMARPEAWREIKMIRTGHKEINKVIGIGETEKNAAFSQFFEFGQQAAGYKLGQYVEEASRKAPKDRNKFDKAVLQTDERVNITYMVFTGELMRLWPKENDPTNKWVATVEAMQTLPLHEANRIRELAFNYFTALDNAVERGEWSQADSALDAIAAYQKEKGEAVYVDESKAALEIWYNHANIFERLWPLYFVVGFVLLILSFVKILRPHFKMAFFTKASFVLLVLFLAAHTVGLGIRWYISGHAPWSDGYESMIYIAWATVLAGFIFSKHSTITMAATGIMTGLILFVAHLNWMDPQVTNLVPVLQSYWLSIHVSMITASYGFLGLGALLGFIALLLFVLKTKTNEKLISLSIKELNYINEMSLMIGLALLTVGNFLGGVWANESWGRYWGWDPKETWALVTILVYAVVVHLRFIKALYSPYLYSVISLLSFTSVLMTYFGVNYYLAGMHSYAKGDPVPIPDFVPVTYGIIFLIIALAYRKRRLAA